MKKKSIYATMLSRTLFKPLLTVSVFVFFTTYLQAKDLDPTITIHSNSISRNAIINEIYQQTGMRLIFSQSSNVSDSKKYTIDVQNKSLTEALTSIFGNQNKVTINYNEKVIVIHSKYDQITGFVKEKNGGPVSDANIVIKGTNKRTISDASGKFSIDANIGDSLIISHTGFETQTIAIADLSEINVVLEASNATKLDEVIVIGYGSARKQDLASAISSISQKEYNQQQLTNVSQIIQGRAAGVQVSDNSGAPGGATSIRIRGNNSIIGDNNPLYVVDGFLGANMSLINPADIQDIQILKDAAATAVFGSRGANGVVLITTKKGNSNRPVIEFNAAYSRASVIKKLDLLNNVDYAKTVNANALGNGTAARFTDAQIDSISKTPGTDWQDLIFRNAPTQQYQLGLSGGTGKTTYYISGEYLNQDGVIINSYRNRYALRGNITSQVNDRFTVRLNTYANRNKVNNATLGGRSGPVMQAIGWSPLVAVRNANGTYTTSDPYGSILASNPVALAADQNNIVINNNIMSILGLNYKILPGLTFDATGGINYINQQTLQNKTLYANLGTAASAARASSDMVSLQTTNNLTYATTINNVHHLTVTGVFEYQTSTTNGFNANANNITFPDQGYYGLALNGGSTVSSSYSNQSILSWLGRVNYDFNREIYITAALRRDGSSKFAKGNQYSSFPSFGIAWNLTNYSFIKNLNIFDNLKIRGGYGVTGSQAINPYQTLLAYANINTPFTQNTLSSGILLGNPGNKNLKWETTKQTDVGIDASLFKGRLAVTVDYYNKNTSDLLFNIPNPDYEGGGFILRNIGNVNNHGWEFAVSGDVIRSGGFIWSSSANYSILRNKLTKLYGNITQIASNSSALGITNVGSGLSPQQEFELVVGKPLGTYWGLEYLGTWKPSEATEAAVYGNKPGDSRYLDYDNNGVINGSDYHPIGSGLPKYSWGWNNNFSYRGFTLNVFIQSLGGFKKLDYTYAAGITANSDFKQATIADIKDRYITGTNETSNIPAFSKTNVNYTQSTRFLEDGTFVRVKNISLSYEVPKDKLKFANLTLFVRGANLFTITKYKGFDPESTNSTASAGSDVSQGIDYGSYPNAKTYTFGLKLNF
ncbi:MAG: TonB-dependent receptor [Pseudopedobacter saltans]|uniref:TonB-dependent receptor n=1 Tax=Pseudopedobacter saltans TaxID=151895 RepID=A0A2W5F9P9_9SPHI|nr:MAG: TonB-dependent receptor [Pseudopedobacter saltans]